MSKKKILFVCTGNTCRSPMAEKIAQKLLEEKGGQVMEIEFFSAGVSAISGMPASNQAIEVMAEEGIELKEHKSSPLTEEVIREADLVLTMTSGHKELILSIFPSYSEKVMSLKEFTMEEAKKSMDKQQELFQTPDVADPFGGSKEIYAECAQELKVLIELALQRLKQ